MKKSLLLLASTALLGTVAITTLADEVGPGDAVKLLQAGKVKSYEELDKVARDLHPGSNIEETELENVYGKYVYKVELRDEAGRQWDIDLDAASGEVLSNHRDD